LVNREESKKSSRRLWQSGVCKRFKRSRHSRSGGIRRVEGRKKKRPLELKVTLLGADEAARAEVGEERVEEAEAKKVEVITQDGDVEEVEVKSKVEVQVQCSNSVYTVTSLFFWGVDREAAYMLRRICEPAFLVIHE
jgi:hypothetical protein